jgi:hypothetical protein
MPDNFDNFDGFDNSEQTSQQTAMANFPQRTVFTLSTHGASTYTSQTTVVETQDTLQNASQGTLNSNGQLRQQYEDYALISNWSVYSNLGTGHAIGSVH